MPQRQYGIRRLIGGVAWIGASGLCGRIIGFAASITLAHALGPAQFGVLAFGLSAAMIFSACASLGLDELLVREIAREGRSVGALLADALILRLLAIPISLIGALVLSVTLKADAWLAACLAAYALLTSYLLSACAAFRGRGRMHVQALLMGGQTALVALVAVSAAWWTGRVNEVALAYVAGTGFVAAFAYVLLLRTEIQPRLAWRPSAWVRLVRTSAPFALGAIGLLASDRLALLSITLVSGPEAAGWFGATQTIVLALAGIATTASMVAFPLLARATVRDPHAGAVLISELIRAALATGLIVSLVLYFGAPLFVPVLFGSGYAPSIAVMQRVAFSIPSVFLTIVLVGTFEATDRQATSARCIIAALPVAAAICLGATWAWGYLAGATAYSISHLVLATLLASQWFRTRQATPRAALREA